MTTNKTLGNKLNALLEKTYDAEAGFKKAAEKINHTTLKSFFKRKEKERNNFGHQLKSEIESIGEEIDKGGSFTGQAHRAWMDVKALLSTDREEAMLEETLKGEQATIEEYNSVLEDSSMPLSTRNLLMSQRDRIEKDLKTIDQFEEVL